MPCPVPLLVVSVWKPLLASIETLLLQQLYLPSSWRQFLQGSGCRYCDFQGKLAKRNFLDWYNNKKIPLLQQKSPAITRFASSSSQLGTRSVRFSDRTLRSGEKLGSLLMMRTPEHLERLIFLARSRRGLSSLVKSKGGEKDIGKS